METASGGRPRDNIRGAESDQVFAALLPLLFEFLDLFPESLPGLGLLIIVGSDKADNQSDDNYGEDRFTSFL
jgi:hypothetical protein